MPGGVLDISLGGELRPGPAPHTLTLLKTKIADFSHPVWDRIPIFDTLFKTFVEHTRRLFIVQEKIPCLR